MRPQAHVASGLLAWCAGDGPLAEAPVCVVAANLPDFDRNVAKALGVKRRDHHRWPSHSPIFWLAPTVLALKLGGRRARRPVACVWLHLLLDTYADGIAWLWPLHREKLGLFRRPPGIRDDGWNTPAPPSTEAGRAEAAMWAAVALSLPARLRRPRAR